MNLDPKVAELALFIAALVAPYIINVVKALGGWQNLKAVWLAFGVSVVIAAVVAAMFGLLNFTAAPNDPIGFLLELAKLSGFVFTIATLIFKHWQEKQE